MRYLLAGLLLLSGRSHGYAQTQRSYDDRPKISVNGDALVKVRPDQIVVRFGIETWDAEITAAKKKNNEILAKAVAEMKRLGVPEKQIQTDHLSIDPRWHDEYRKDRFLGYFVRNTVTATISDPAKVEGLITKVLQTGVNHIHGVDFQTTELKKHREQARDMALRAAREKAEKMAAALGQTVGSPIQISEGHMGSWLFSNWSGWGYGRGHGMSQNVAQNVQENSGEAGDTLALGTIEIRAGVNVVFELK